MRAMAKDKKEEPEKTKELLKSKAKELIKKASTKDIHDVPGRMVNSGDTTDLNKDQVSYLVQNYHDGPPETAALLEWHSIIDILIAQHVYGLQDIHVNDWYFDMPGYEHIGGVYEKTIAGYDVSEDLDPLRIPIKIPSFSLNTDNAFKAVDSLIKHHGISDLTLFADSFGNYTTEISLAGQSASATRQHSENPATAICLSILAAMQVEVPVEPPEPIPDDISSYFDDPGDPF
jgi:hypothetical protein